MTKKATAAMTALVMMAVPMTAFAGDFEDFYDYQAENGKFVYYFENGVKLEMPEDWYQNVTVEAEESYVTFYHKDSYEKYKKDGYDAGGELLKIGCSVNTDFKDNPGYEYIGFDEEEALNFYYSTPTDYQAYTKDADVKAEFDQLLGELDEVCDSITLTAKPDDEFHELMEDSAEAARIAQNAAEGKKQYSADKAVVLSQEYFSESAKETASEMGVDLWGRDKFVLMLLRVDVKYYS